MKKLLVAIAVLTSFLVGYGALGHAWPVFGRDEMRGYFTNTYDEWGVSVFPIEYAGDTEAFPSSINSANEFISFVKGKLGGDAQERTGAAFIIQTMIGSARQRPPTAGQIAEWEKRVRFAESRGLITWRKSFNVNINSFYQGRTGGGGTNDAAFYKDSERKDAMVFRNLDGDEIYAIKWECANPVGHGSITPIEEGYDFNMSGRSTVNNANPAPGAWIRFDHFVRNSGPDATPMGIRVTTQNTVTGATVRPLTGASTFDAGEEKSLMGENYRVPVGTPAGTQICRRIGWTPDTYGGGMAYSPHVCATVRYDYGLTPEVTVRINNGDTPGTTAEPGDKITFEYSIRNNGSTQSEDTNCVTNGRTFVGYEPSPTGFTNVADPGLMCEVISPHTTEVVGSRDIIAVPNTTVCRSLTVTPSAPGTPDPSATSNPPTCAVVATKPYVKVFGGDVSVGGGIEAAGSCGQDNKSGIIAWNKRNVGAPGVPPPLWAGAGTQYATMALKSITDFATTQASGGAPYPSGLAFSNNTVSAPEQANGLFGKSAGAVSCTPDYFNADARITATPIGGGGSPVIAFNSGTLEDKAYKTPANTAVTLNGSNIIPGQRLVVYVDGDLFINGNVIFQPGWGVANAPLFQIVASGNIYIAPGVSRLDGTYIAQRNSTAPRSGEIYTCTDPAPGKAFTPLTLDGALLTRCDDFKLTVNGSMVADRILLLRTLATLRASNVGETRTANSAAEVFNYSPANWIAQPGTATGVASDQYDSITSLPPVL